MIDIRHILTLYVLLSLSSHAPVSKAFVIPTTTSTNARRDLSVLASHSIPEVFFESHLHLTSIFKRTTAADAIACEILDSLPESTTSSPALHSSYSDSGIPSSQAPFMEQFLNYLQSSLLENNNDSADGLMDETTFIDRGRELLAITRFQVMENCQWSDIHTVVWNEIDMIRQAGKEDTGALILLPGFVHHDLVRFAQSHVSDPLQWLGAQDDWSIKAYTSLEDAAPFPAIRLLHKLTPAPTRGTSEIATMTEEDAELDRKVDYMYEKAERQVREKKEIKVKRKQRKNIHHGRPGGMGFGA